MVELARLYSGPEEMQEWAVSYTAQMVVWHMILLEDHLFSYADAPDAQCVGCMIWHCEKLKAYTTLESPKFFAGETLETYNRVGQMAAELQDHLLDDTLTAKMAEEYATGPVRELRYGIAQTETFAFNQEDTVPRMPRLCDYYPPDVDEEMEGIGHALEESISLLSSAEKNDRDPRKHIVSCDLSYVYRGQES